MRFVSVVFGLALSVACTLAFGKDGGETLLVSSPPGYKIDYQAKNDRMITTEMVPEKQSVKNWTEMVTIQVFYGLKASPEQFMGRVEEQVKEACPGAEVTLIRQGKENGYPFNLFLQHCPLNKETGKLEITWFKTTEGNDSFYVVQFATKHEPAKETITKWMQYLASAIVCDTRSTEHACGPAPGSGQR